MNTKKKLTIGFAGAVLAGALGFAAIASASGTTSPSSDAAIVSAANAVDAATNTGADIGGLGNGGAKVHLTQQQKCDNKDAIIAKATALQKKVTDRITTLQTKRAAAVSAGNDQKVQRIDARLARLNTLQTRITTRLARFQTWVTTNCTAASTTTGA